MLVVDASWHRLRPARLAGLNSHFRQMLSENAGETLDSCSSGYLLAATENDADNALVCTRFANEFGRKAVLQLPMPGADEHEKKGFTATLRGQRAFSEGALF